VRFSDVLKDRKQRFTGTAPQDIPAEAAAAPAFAPPAAFADIKQVTAGSNVAQPDAILSSLAHEITAEAPPGGSASVEIQFDSRTLQGLHVRVQKTADRLDVRFSTSSEAVSRLLTANADSLAQALIQRGYVAPSIAVQSAPVAASATSGGFRRPARGGDRGQQGQGGSQKRR
jgi:hypothetical protein